MGCIESSHESRPKRSQSTAMQPAHNGQRTQTSQKRQGKHQINSSVKRVDIGVQTEFEGGGVLLRRLSSRIKQRYRRSTRVQRSTEPFDWTMLFDLNRTVDLNHSRVSQYIEQALTMPGEQRLESGVEGEMMLNGSVATGDEAPVSVREKRLIQGCWKEVQKDLVEFGVDLVVRLLEQNPSLRELFPFGKHDLSAENLSQNLDLRAHGHRVMETINTAVEGLDDWEVIISILEDLGARHKVYGAAPEHFPLLEEAFMYSLRNGLPPKAFTSEVQEAWGNLWKEFAVIMSKTMRGEQGYDETYNKDLITAREKQLVQGCWMTVQKDLDNLGAAVFVRLLEKNPAIKNIFPFGKLNLSLEKLKNNPDLRAHAKGVMETIGAAVARVDDLRMVVPILEDLGARHKLYGAKPEHFKPLEEAFMYSLRTGLPPKAFTSEVQEAWGNVWKAVGVIMSKSMRGDQGYDETYNKDLITAREKQLVQGCWMTVQKDLDNLGAAVFVRLLEQNPAIKNIFPFGKLNLSPEKLKNNPDLRAHAKGVMETIGAAVARVDDLRMVVPILKDLGARHKLYGAKPEHFKPLEEAFMYSLRTGLPPKAFTSEVQEAWGNVWKAVGVIMSKSMRGDQDYDETYNKDLITAREKQLVQGCWMTVQNDLDNLGAAVFVRLLEQNPAIKNIFPFGKLNLSPEKLKNNPDLRAHAKGVMETIGAAVARVDDLRMVVPILEDLGARHKLYGAKPEHFKPLEEAFMYSLRTGLPPKAFTSEVQEAWGNVWKAVGVIMSKSMRGDQDYDETYNKDLITAREKQLVQGCWMTVQNDLDNLGAAVFVRLLEQNPAIKNIFPFGKLNLSPEKLKNNPDLRAHAKGVMETIGAAVARVDDLRMVVPILEDLGARHKLYGAKPEHFKPLEEAFMYSLRTGLPPKAFTSEVQEAWGNVWKAVGVIMSKSMRGDKDYDETYNKDLITAREKQLVQGCWMTVQKDLDNLGAAVFVRLLEQNPAIKNIFPFGKLNLSPEKLKNNPDLRAHAKGVMETIGAAVARVDDLRMVVPILEDLGARHKLYGAKPEHFKPLEEAFMYSLRTGLPPKAFTSEVQEAWGNVWKAVGVIMSKSMRGDQDYDETYNKDLITAREKQLVQGCWMTVQKDLDNLGAAVFVRLLEQNPAIKNIFPFGKLNLSPEKLKNNPDLRAHAKGVMETIGAAVARVDDLRMVVPILEDLGARHKLYGAKPEHFKPLEEAFMYSLRTGLPPKAFTSEVQEAWGNVWKAVGVIMSKSMRGDQGYDETYNKDLITAREKQLVQGCWMTVQKDLDNLGAAVFVRLLEQNPAIKNIFPFGKLNLSPEKLKNNPDLRAHAKGVMETIGAAVARVDDLRMVVPILEDLGARHKLYGAKPEHFKPLEEAFMYSLRTGLPPKAFTSEVQEAWGNVWKAVGVIMSKSMRGDQDYDETYNKDLITAREKQLVQGCWMTVQKDLDNLGAAVFVRLLEQNPAIKNIFPFGKLNLSPEKLKNNPDLRAHAKGVMETIGAAVARVDDLRMVVPILEDLGARHKLYGAKPEHFKPLEEAFMYSLRTGLPPKTFTSEVQEAWGNVWKAVGVIMSKSMRGDQGYDETYNKDLITAREKQLVQGCWMTVQKDLDNLGAAVFVRLLEQNPAIKNIFPFGKLNLSPEKLKNNPDLRAHAKGVMETIGAAVARVDDLRMVVPILEDLGARHQLYGAKPEHFKPLEEAFMYSLRTGLPPKAFTSEVQEAWGNVWKAVGVIMSKSMRGDQDYDETYNKDLITAREKQLVQGCWMTVQKDLDNLGAAVFVRLLEQNPAIKNIFPFGKLNLSPEKLKNNPDLRAHAKGVMETIGAALARVDDLRMVVPILEDLGARHKLYGAKPEHFKPLEEAFMYSLRTGLPPKTFTSEVQEAWGNVWKAVGVIMSKSMRGDQGYDETYNKDLITAREKQLVQGCWMTVQKDLDNLGAAVFVRLLEQNPAIKNIFPFGKLNLSPEKLKNNPDLRAHAKGVMETIGAAVARVDDLRMVVPILEDLGARHKLYGAKPEHFKPLEEAFMYSLRTGLPPKTFTSEVQEAWGNVWKAVGVIMSKSMRGDQGYDETYNKDLITAREKQLVQGCWMTVQKDLDNLGAAVFVRLLEQNPAIKNIFPFGKLNLSPEKLKNNPDLRAHAKGVMETIGAAVARVDDLRMVVPILEDLGARHQLYGAKPEHFKPLEEAFMYSLRTGLPPKAFTSEVQEAWGNVWKAVGVIMSKSMRGDQDYDETYNKDLITAREKQLVQGCWMTVQKDLDNLGAAVFVRLLEQNPAIKNIFPFGKLNLSPEKLKNNPDLRAHAKGVMETIGAALARVDDLRMVVPILEDLGARHKLYGAKPEHFKPLEEAFMYSLRTGLPPKTFTSEVQEAWGNVWKAVGVIMSKSMRGDQGYDETYNKDLITAREKQLVQGCWMTVQKDLDNLGAAVFVRLLEQNPAIKNIFPFGKLNLSPEKLKNNPDLRAHAKGVMETIGAAVARVDDLRMVVPILEDLGARHQLYGAKPEHFKPLEEAFMYSLRTGLPPKAFTSEVQEAWGNVWKAVGVIMSKSMRGDQDYDETYNKDLITAREKQLVQGCWMTVQKDLDNLGAAVFVRLLEQNSAIKNIFPFGKLNLSPEKLKNNPDLRAHAKGVMETIGAAVARVDDLRMVVPILEDLGARHKLYGAKPEHFKPLEEAFMYSLRTGLPPKAFTSEVQEAWGNVWKAVGVIMSKSMRGDQGYDETYNKDLITAREKQLVQGCWMTVQKDLDNLGAAVFVRLLEQNPAIKNIFPFGKLNLSPEKLKNNPDLRAHAKGVMETIGAAVARVDDLRMVVPILEDLGARHKLYGAKPEHFKPLEEAFMYSLMRTGLPPKAFTSEVQEAWGNVWKAVGVIMSKSMRGDQDYDETYNKDLITAREKQLVQGCWMTVQKDLDNLGAAVFVRLLEQNPAIQNIFPFGKLNLSPEKLKNNPDLRAHAKGVMETIGAAVARVDDLRMVVPILKDLGARHKLYGAKPEHFKPLEEAFMYSLRTGLPPKAFTSEVQEAWGNVWKAVGVIMSKSMRGDQGYDETYNTDLITAREKQLVQGCWMTVQKDLDNLGAAVFVSLLEQNPTIKNLFPFGKLNLSPAKLKNNPDLRAHAKGVMESIGAAVAGLDDLRQIVPMLEDLGARHKLYGAKPEHFKPLEEAFIDALKNGLSAKVFTSEVEAAWMKIFKVVAELMSCTMRSDKSDLGPISARDKQLVQGCWKVMQKDLVNLGATLFVRLLEKNPPIQNLFTFGKLNLPPEKLKRNKDLRFHGQRVMETIGAAVDGLDDLEIISTILEDLGARHNMYGAKPEHFPHLEEAFMFTLKSSLPPKVFTSDVQDAWRNIMQAVAAIMNRTMRSDKSDLGPISTRDKQLVQGCWKVMQKDLVNLGATLFVRLLEKNPPIQNLFTFGKLNLPPEKLKRNKDLRFHGQRVMETIGAAVDGLDDLEIISTILEDLGARHNMYGAKPEHFPHLEEAFMFTLKSSLPLKVFTSEVQDAWRNIMQAVAAIMNRTMRSDKSDLGPISTRDKQLVQGCWKVMQKDLVNLGATLFVRLLEKNPPIQNLFTFGKLNLPPEKLKRNKDLRFHGQRVMETIGAAVDGLDDLEIISTILEDLGARHNMYGAKPEHFPNLEEAFMFTLKSSLPPKVFTSEVQDAWRNIMQAVAAIMNRTMRSDKSDLGPISARDKQLVQGCWKVMQKDLVNLGATLFVRLLEKNPPIQNLFTFGKLNLPPEKLKRNKDLRFHGQRVMETIGAAVDGLDDLEIISTILEDLGARHNMYGAKPEHFPHLEEAFMFTLKSSLPPKVFTPEVQDAWRNIMQAVAAIMNRTMRSGNESTDEELTISPRDKRLVQGCWKFVQKDLNNLGAVLFVRLLEQNPSIKNLFPFGKLNLSPEKLKNNPDLRAHAKGVMETIGAAVAGLDDLIKIVPMLEDLGARHKLYGATPEHFPAIAEAFMFSLKNGLSSKVFTSEVHEAWRNIFKVLHLTMGSAMSSNDTEEPDEGPISRRDKNLVQGSWKIMQKDLVNLGASFFVRLLDKNPAIGDLFPFGQLSLPPLMLKHNSDLRSHGKGVMETLGTVVDGLDDLGKIVLILKDLGARHRIYGATPEHFQPLAEAFMYAMKSGLPSKVFTSEVQEAWGNIWNVVAAIMSNTME